MKTFVNNRLVKFEVFLRPRQIVFNEVCGFEASHYIWGDVRENVEGNLNPTQFFIEAQIVSDMR